MSKSDLAKAKKDKNDEFYTRYEDIEKEINAYLDYNKNAFKGKVVLLPCDDPDWSSFTMYFAQNFTKLGLKKLISTSYGAKVAGKPVKGKIFTLTVKDKNKDGKVNIGDLS